MIRKLIFVGSLLFFVLGLRAQEFNYGQHHNKGEKLNYRVLFPENFNTNDKFPLVLFLHGSGERGTDNEKQLVHGSKLFSENINSFPAIVVFPQCPPDQYWSNVVKKKTNAGIDFEYSYGGPPTPAMELLLSMLDSMLTEKFIDKNRVYVGGLSMGGMGTFELLWRRNDTFAAAFSICGGGSTEFANHYDQNLSIWIFHGAKDDVVKPEQSKKLANALDGKIKEVKYSLYPNANHNSWDPAFAEKNLLHWLFSKTKMP